jgi:hypothetical protein
VAAAHHLRTETRKTVQGRAKLGIEAFAEALMGFPKVGRVTGWVGKAGTAVAQ